MTKNSDFLAQVPNPAHYGLDINTKLLAADHFRKLLANPDMLAKEPAVVQELLRPMLKSAMLAANPMPDIDLDDDKVLLSYLIQTCAQNIHAVNTMLTQFQSFGNEKLDPSETAKMIKDLSAVQDRLLVNLEKAKNYRNVSEFRTRLVAILDRVLTVDQRNDVIGEIKALAHIS